MESRGATQPSKGLLVVQRGVGIYVTSEALVKRSTQ